MADLELTNVITISVAETPAGIGAYNTSNLAIFTDETADVGFGDDGFKIYLEPSEIGTDFGTSSSVYKMALGVFSQQPNILAGGGYLVVIKFTDGTESLGDAISRTKDLVQYFGIIAAKLLTAGDILDAAQVTETLNKICFLPSNDPLMVDEGGGLDAIRSANLHKSRGLYYGSDESIDCLVMAASYAGRALSTDFSGSNTTETMHLKDLKGVEPDASVTQTLKTKALAAGVDIYPSIQGVAKVLTSGANRFFDQMYNQEWLVGALQVAGFNALAQSSTKLAQTEDGVGVLKAAYRQVLELALTNQYAAPGTWNSPNTFGNLNDFLRNIKDRGYYIYSSPVATQSQVDREARKAPLIQIALKEAGAIHSSSVIVFINA